MIGAQKIFKFDDQTDQFLLSKIQGLNGNYFGIDFPDMYSFSITAKYILSQKSPVDTSITLVWWEEVSHWAIYLPASTINLYPQYGTGKLIIEDKNEAPQFETLILDFELVHVEGYYPSSSAIDSKPSITEIDNMMTANLSTNKIVTTVNLADSVSPISDTLDTIKTSISDLPDNTAASVWNSDDRTLTSTSGTGGATISEIGDLLDEKDYATKTDVENLNDVSETQVYTQVSNAIDLKHVLTNDFLTASLVTLAKATDLATANAALVSIKTDTSNISSTSIYTQVNQALSDASIPGSIDDLVTLIQSVKTKTDTIDWSMIKEMYLEALGNISGIVKVVDPDTGAISYEGSPVTSIDGFGTIVWGPDSNGNRRTVSITMEV